MYNQAMRASRVRVPGPGEGYTTSRPSPREEAARENIVRAIVLAKRELGLRTSEEMKQAFFVDLWPDILRHLKETGYKPPK